MTTYYVCRAASLTELELSQTEDERMACDIVSAACVYEDLGSDLVAIEADSENGTYAHLKGGAMYTMELTESNMAIWKSEGKKIHEYLLGPADDDNQLWRAFGALDTAMDDYENTCEQSEHFNGLGKGFSYAITSHIDEKIHEEMMDFANVMEDLFAIEEIKTVTG